MKVVKHKAYRFRIYPNREQETLLSKHFGCARFVYNYFLNRRTTQYKETGKSSNYNKQASELTALKKEEPTEWLKEVNSQTLQASLKNLDSSFQKFFKKQSKYPKFHSRKQKNSFTVPQNARLEGNKLFLPKFKQGIKCIVHRVVEGKIGKVTITRTATGKYFVAIFTEQEVSLEVNRTGAVVGIDLGISSLAITSDNEVFENNKFTKKYESALATAQKHLSRKKKGSQRYERQRLKVALIHEKIANARADNLHKVSNRLVQDHDVIFLEDLNVKGMVKNRKLAKAISDASWGKFVLFLTYKADWQGKSMVKVDRFFASSQTCNACGVKSPITKELKVRAWKCPNCGTPLDRDLNAARNILDEGIKLSRQGLASTPMERPEDLPSREGKSL